VEDTLYLIWLHTAMLRIVGLKPPDFSGCSYCAYVILIEIKIEGSFHLLRSAASQAALIRVVAAWNLDSAFSDASMGLHNYTIAYLDSLLPKFRSYHQSWNSFI
jgi:hypothetical protein